jgi:hypothetical protein
MKKVLLATAGTMFVISASAQKVNIQNAINARNEKDYKQALEYIGKAVNDPSTKDEPKAWFVRGAIYTDMQNDAAHKAENPYREAARSYLMAAQLKPSYEKETIDNELIGDAYMYYNDAVAAYSAKKFDDAVALAQKTVEIHDMDGGKRFAKKSFDTVSVNAKVIAAYSQFYGGKYDEALTSLLDLRNNPIGKEPNVYLVLSDLYGKQKKNAEQIAIIEEGRTAYPDNAQIRNEELNYYIKAGKQDILMKKLEDAVAKEPNNPILLFNLANGYNNMAFPKDANGKELPKPANYGELIAKAEAAYTAALKADANNVDYSYNIGVLYFNQASDVNKQMNALGTTAADQKNYDELKAKRDFLFGQALPHFDKVYQNFDAKTTSLNAEDKFTYQSTLVAMKEIYAKQNNMARSDEMKKKLEASKK